MGRRGDLNGYVDRLLDGLAGRVAAQLTPEPAAPPPPAATLEPVAAAPPEPEPETESEPPVPPRAPVLSDEELAALAVLTDPRIAADLRRADLEPDRFARPYEEVGRALGLG